MTTSGRAGNNRPAHVNLLVSPLPERVIAGGDDIPIASGYRVGIQIARAVDSGLNERLLTGLILHLYFGSEKPADVSAALEAALEFHRCGYPPPKKKGGSGPRMLDWDHDAGRILADFAREYGIDLADEDLSMHWWKFMAYFDNLSSESETKRAMYYRSARPRGLKGDDLKRFNELKQAYALPPRTRAEIEEREAALWGE